MARTKSSRGIKPFQLKSGNTTPYPFLRGLKNAAKNLFSKTPVGMAAKAMKGGGGADDMNTKIDEIHSALVGEEGQDTAMTKRPGPLYHGDHQDPQVGLSHSKSTEEKRHRHVFSNVNQGRPKD